MTYTDKELDNVLDISYLKIKVGHPNGTETFISKIGNLKLSNGLTLYDVMVIPEYYVTLIYVYKLAKENKVIVAFDESRCYFLNQDLNLKNVLGIGDQCEGLLGHPAEPVLNVLKDSLQINKKDNTFCCEICQRAKQTREHFPLSDHTSKCLGDLVHLDLWRPYRVTSSEGFRYFLTVVDDYTRADSEIEKNDSTNAFQDVNHINFFNIEYPEIPNDDERVANSLNKGKSDSSSSSVSGSNINTADFLVDSENDADSSDELVATQNEGVATLEENVFSEGNLDQNPSSSQGVQNVRREPKSYFEASKYPHWTDAMNQEMDALLRNGTWKIVELPEGRKSIGCKWIYKIKFRSSGEIDRYKARLVAQGFGQKEGIDYEETFSHVVKMVTVRCLLNIVVSMSWPVFQLDVNNAFLYGDLEEVVYMKPPKGFFPSDNKSDKGVFLALLVYVDDIIITGSSLSEIEKFKVYLKSKFMIKDLGKLKERTASVATNARQSKGKLHGIFLTTSFTSPECSETKSDKQDTSSRSGNDADIENADIRPVNDQVPFAEVQLTALHNVLTNEQQHSVQSEPIYDTHLLEKVDRNTTPDSTNTCHRGGEIDQNAKKCQVSCPLLDPSFDNMTPEFSNQSLDKSVENVDLKAQIQEKVFANAALKNELRKLKGNSVDTKFSKPSILGKPILQPPKNQSVVRQPNAFKSERPNFSKPRFASQVDVNNVLSKSVTPRYLHKVREYVLAKPHHVIAPSSSRNSQEESYGSNDMAHNHYLEETRKRHKKEIGIQNLV
ncbi:ribonuclease H-like domain-containing protein [Tanacetum coccineum]